MVENEWIRIQENGFSTWLRVDEILLVYDDEIDVGICNVDLKNGDSFFFRDFTADDIMGMVNMRRAGGLTAPR